MHTPEVVPRVPQGDHVRVVLKLLTEGIRQAGKAPHTHSHVQVLPLDVRSRDVFGVGVAGDGLRDRADTGRGAVSRIRFKIPAVDLNQHGIVDAAAERILDSGQVHSVAVRRQLDAIGQPRLNVLKEYRCKPGASLSHEPADNELCLRLNGGKSPDIATDTVPLQFLLSTFFCLQPTNDQISSTCTRLALTFRTTLLWNSVQAVPTLTSKRRIAPLETPVMRDVDRTEHPSTSAVMTATFFAILITFAMT